MLYFTSPREVRPRKKRFEMRILKVFYCLQTSLTRASLAGLSLSGHKTALTSLHQVFICGTHVLSPWYQFWTQLQAELAHEGPYQKASIGGLRLRLPELQAKDQEARKIREQGLTEGCEEIEEVLQHQDLPYVPKIVRTKLISRYHDDPLAGHFGIDNTRELIARKYYWPTLHRDVETYVIGGDIYLALKAVRHMPYGNLQSLPVPIH